KSFFVLRSALRNQFVNRTMRRDALQQLLKIALRIEIDRLVRQLRKIGTSLCQNEIFGNVEAAIQVKRADERFERVGQGGRTLPATAGFFPTPHQNVTTQVERSSMRPQRIARNQP